MRHSGAENKLELIYEDGKFKDVRVRSIKGKKGLSDIMLKDAVRFVRTKESQITNKWISYFVKKKEITCEKITKKI